MKYKILVVTGGGFDEREISLKTAENVCFHLRNMGHIVEVLDVQQVNLVNYFMRMLDKPDLVFNCLHGKFGEDGQIQSIFEWFGLRYTHSGCSASAIAMNKKACYYLAESVGISCPLSHFLSFKEYQESNYTNPHVIKPIDNGSSVKVHFVDSVEKKKSIQMCGDELMLQDYIPGLELTVTVLSGSAVNCVEITFANDIFSEEFKYNGSSKYKIFNNLSVRNVLFDWAEKIHKLIGCSGVTRSDFRYNPSAAGENSIYYLETNTQPGLSKNSIIPKMLDLMGVSFENFLDIMIRDAMDKEVHQSDLSKFHNAHDNNGFGLEFDKK